MIRRTLRPTEPRAIPPKRPQVEPALREGSAFLGRVGDVDVYRSPDGDFWIISSWCAEKLGLERLKSSYRTLGDEGDGIIDPDPRVTYFDVLQFVESQS